ncbi:PAS domain-containing sensor histidine kinase [Caulobacter sp. RL271]|jgi:PAS domain S-box-containing protein|uniref:histidine kinase n=1 Tax=Caulobacter segnis TaxID=88688 RepID=A0ABY4ZSY1_9CAUL|nr:PAS domain S-box protein [Caulobacter segnis]USQ95927.1 PAS domain S-box protein [Caulobacter segnis]
MPKVSTPDPAKPTPSPFGEAEAARWFFDNASDLFTVVSPEGRFITVNAAWTALTGWSRDETIGQPTLKFTHPDSQAELIDMGRRLTETGSTVTELRIRCKDGAWIWLQGQGRLGPNGERVGLLHDASAKVAAREELEAARRTRELLSEAAGVGVWSYEPEGERIDWSPDALTLLGLTPADVSTAEQFLARLPDNERKTVHAAFSQATLTGQGGTIEFRLRGDDGRWQTFRSTYRVEPRPGGLHALKGISQNITDVARSRDKAIWSERRARRLVEDAPFAVAVYDLDMRLRLVSPRFLEIFRSTEVQVIGKTLSELTHGGRRRFVAAVSRALAGEIVARREDRLQDADGVERAYRWEARPWRDISGQIVGVITYMDDVTALAKARREARINARRLKVALGAARAGVYEIDHEGQSFWGSPELHRMLGRRVGYDDVREAVWPMIHPEDRDQLYAAAATWRATGEWGAHECDVRVLSPGGEARWVRVFHDVRRDAGGRARKAFGLMLDIDEKKKAELALVAAERAAQAANEAKAQFLANMSHEIRTPMNGVLGVMHVLKRELPPGDSADLLGEALAAGQMLSTLLDDVIDISRIEAGRLDLNREAVDPRDLVRGVARLLAGQATHKGLRLELDLADDLGWIETDPTRVRQALFNLIGNAVKFTLKGSVTVRLRRAPGGGKPRLVFDVVDTGVGVPLEAHDKLFERFQQADASTTRRFGGSGLGLAITRKLAQMLGGEVSFTSTPGEGSTFTLTIAAPPAAAPDAAPAHAEDLLDGLKVLVVEDNPTNQLVARRILEQLGAAVSVADDGASGVDAARDGAFDLILMDVQMPGMDGLEAARRIRALPGPAARAPIIALTANVMAHQRASYRAAGMDGVAAKPISPAALVAEIVRLSQAGTDTRGAVA